MRKTDIKNFISTIQKGQEVLRNLPHDQRDALEKVWDVEHAYYSSALEGSKIDRKQFDKFAEKLS